MFDSLDCLLKRGLVVIRKILNPGS